MITLFHAAKGGSGTTVVAAQTALALRGRTILVDLDDELPLALGSAPSATPGVIDWMNSDAPLEHLADLVDDVTPTTQLLSTRAHGPDTARSTPWPSISVERWMQLTSWCRQATTHGAEVLIDIGTRQVPREFVAACDQRLLVTRACYLGITAAQRHPIDPTGVVLLTEPGRALGAGDISRSIGVPVVASIAWDPAVVRSVDAGLLASGTPRRTIAKSLRRVARTGPNVDTAA